MNHTRIQLPHCELESYVPVPTTDPNRLRPAVVICPGGAYAFTSEREAEPVAMFFAAKGFNAYVCWYRTTPAVYPDALYDVGAAVAWVREHADEHRTNPNGIAVLGFSAGGHAACDLGVRWHDEALMASLGLACEAVKPNAMVLCYPVITAGEYAHRGSFEYLTGSKNLADHAPHSLENLVDKNTPPTFLWHTWTDGSVPVMNTLLFAQALYKAGVGAEVHIYPRGGHGLSLANELMNDENGTIPECQEWPELAARYLRQLFA